MRERCSKKYDDPSGGVMECDVCQECYCVKCQDMSPSVYDYMMETLIILCREPFAQLARKPMEYKKP